jgi:hypothetical protein
MKYSPTLEPLARLSCRIETADIEAMLDAYDSGMCDISTANCLTRAITRELAGDQRVKLLHHGKNHFEVEVRGQRLPLCERLQDWLHRAETGGHVEPVDVVLHLAGPYEPDDEAGPRFSHATMVQ